jgi:hypothetical protein
MPDWRALLGTIKATVIANPLNLPPIDYPTHAALGRLGLSPADRIAV